MHELRADRINARMQTHGVRSFLERKERYLLKWKKEDITCLLFTWFF